MKKVICLLILMAGAMTAQTTPETSTVLNQNQLPTPIAVPDPVAPIKLEIPVAGTAANTFTLTKQVTKFVMCMWNGLWLTVGLDFVFTGTGTGGTLLTPTPAAIAQGMWATGTSACLYQ